MVIGGGPSRCAAGRSATIRLPPGDPAWGEALGLLQAGFLVSARIGLSARSFMRDILRFEDEYIEGAVSTVFIDSKPVDDIDAAVVVDGSLLALSAAMPGLVGAVMRRKSPYSSFRKAISYSSPLAGPKAEGRGEGLVRVKLFNSVMRDRGRDLLSRGILVAEAQARSLGAASGASSAVASGDEEGLVFLQVLEG